MKLKLKRWIDREVERAVAKAMKNRFATEAEFRIAAKQAATDILDKNLQDYAESIISTALTNYWGNQDRSPELKQKFLKSVVEELNKFQLK